MGTSLNYSLIVKVKDVHVMENLYSLCYKEGFYNVELQYMGGLWLMMSFDSILDRKWFEELVELVALFKDIRLVSDSFTLEERMTWVEIGGLLLIAWSANSYKKSANLWGNEEVSIEGTSLPDGYEMNQEHVIEDVVNQENVFKGVVDSGPFILDENIHKEMEVQEPLAEEVQILVMD
ncbi:hypothetical protein L1987_07222 [Smallanthus sonchifolius]|uniref:Uncharacterized protein n=1 Tax=Smallanthus sonchifolius TaxID=185202 RepID=A0ACB9K0B2_9ASTR|nr:hypothetical protein L1987_07222 [Smallanthus sonchifolius]